MLFFGPGDFSHAIGAPGDMDNQELVKARERIAVTARKYGKFAATACAPSQRQALVDMGYTF
ncbi:MAG: aldolase, partial [Lentisphaerae bacterium]|nr:aldolase [Lentisphaerota bacterium]